MLAYDRQSKRKNIWFVIYLCIYRITILLNLDLTFLRLKCDNINKVYNLNFKTTLRTFCNMLLTYLNIIDLQRSTINMHTTNNINLRVITRLCKEIWILNRDKNNSIEKDILNCI